MPVVNLLIESLPPRLRNRVLHRCERVDMVAGAILCEPQDAFRYVYFPVTGYIVLVLTVDGHQPLKMRLIGNEGMLGATLALGVNVASLRGVVQGSGTALRMTAAQLRREMLASPPLRLAVDRYLYVLMAQMAQTAACVRFHDVPARLARLLLMTHDRAHSDCFYFTHQGLADLLGVRRSAVTRAACTLHERKLIHYLRGNITMLSRSGLEAASCECYDAVIESYTRILA